MNLDSLAQQLGYDNYSDYLSSTHWKTFKRNYAKTEEGRAGCLICNNPDYHVHHCTYQNLGEELFEDVVALCNEHHMRVHGWLRKNDLSVEDTHLAIEYVRTNFPCESYAKKDGAFSFSYKQVSQFTGLNIQSIRNMLSKKDFDRNDLLSFFHFLSEYYGRSMRLAIKNGNLWIAPEV